MSHVLIVGCGIVGAMIAYELSSVSGLNVTVLDRQPPAQAATGAALGVLMGAISHKIKGNAWQMRSFSLERYQTLIPELEALTKRRICVNRQGIVMLCFAEDEVVGWEKLAAVRSQQGWHLELWNTIQLHAKCPHLNTKNVAAAIYSPQDRQVDPTALTLGLVAAAKHNGVHFHFGVTVTGYYQDTTTSQLALQLQKTNADAVELPEIAAVDWLVIAAGIGSTQLQSPAVLAPPNHTTNRLNLATAALPPTPVVEIKPVLGQAMQLRLDQPLKNTDFQPVVSGNDVHLVPCVGSNPITDYWVGATVEFSSSLEDIVADAAQLEAVRQQAIAFCPVLAAAKIIRTWSGLRPRPEKRPAPVIDNLPGFSNILLATGHYRNGVLLAPATAQRIREVITKREARGESEIQ